MLKTCGQARSRAFRVLWLANEARIAYEHIPASIERPAAKVARKLRE
jgi:hypothetical protein